MPRETKITGENEKTLLNVRLPRDLVERAKALANRRGMNLTSLIGYLLYLELEKSDEGKRNE